MIARVLTAFRLELLKAIRTPYFFVAPFAVSMIVLAAPLTHSLTKDGESDYSFLVFSIPFAINLVGTFLILIYTASLISSEAQNGTIRSIFVRPIHRSEFFLAKYLLATGYALGNLLLATTLALFMNVFLGDMNGVQVGGEIIYTNSEMMYALTATVAAATLPLFAAVSYALFISVCTRSIVLAVITTLGIWLLVDLTKYPLHYAQFSFTSYLETPWDVFAEMSEGFSVNSTPDIFWLLGVCLITIAIFVSGSLAILTRRDYTP